MRCNPVELPRNSGKLGIPTMNPQQTVNDRGKSSFTFCCLTAKWLKRRALEPLLLFYDVTRGTNVSAFSLPSQTPCLAACLTVMSLAKTHGRSKKYQF